jgi:hypothetical protein
MKYENYRHIALQIKSPSLAVIGSACDFRYGWFVPARLAQHPITNLSTTVQETDRDRPFQPVKETDLPFYRYKKHLGLDVNVKNARVRARAEYAHNAIPVVCGGGNCSCYPHCRPDSFNSRGGREMIEVFRSEVVRG